MDRLTCCVVAPTIDPLLAGCLDSVADTADEIVVVTSEPDAAWTFAKPVGARVVAHDFVDGVGAARNRALAASGGEWVLALEAHERLAPHAGRPLLRALDADAFDCGLLPLHAATRRDATPVDVLSGKARKGAPVLWPRLMRRTPDLHWEGLVQATVVRWLAEGRRLAQVQAPILAWGHGSKLALRMLQRRVAADPLDWSARTDLARELARRGEVQQALEEVEIAWKQGAAGSRAGALPILRAFLQLQAGAPEQALSTLDAASGGSPSLDLLRGASLERLVGTVGPDPRFLAEAEATLVRAKQGDGIDPIVDGATSWAADTLLGLVHLHEQRFADALWRFERALERNPEHLDALLGRAEALIGLGQASEALQTLEPVLEVSESDGWMLAASACNALGLTQDADTLLARARDEDRFVAAHRERASARLTAEIQAAATLHELDPTVSIPAVGDPLAEGQARFARGDLQGAHACFKAALRQDARHVEAWSDLGVSLAADADLQGAERALRTAVGLEPEAPLPRANLAAVLWQLDQVSEAVGHLRTALRVDDELAPARNLLSLMGVEGATRPMALVVDNVETPEATLLLAHDVLSKSGLRVLRAHPDLVASFAGSKVRTTTTAIQRFLERCPAQVVVIDATAGQARVWAESAREVGALVVWVGDRPVSGAAVLPRDPAAAFQPLRELAHKLSRQTPSAPNVRPRLSVLLTAGDTPERLVPLLDALALQDLPPSLFEVVVVTTGESGCAAELGVGRRPYPLTVVSDAAADNRARARDRALVEARADVVVLLDPDTRPASDCLRGHLVAQARAREPLALQGAVVPSATALRMPLGGLDARQLASPAVGSAGARLPGRFLRTGNTSVPRKALEAAGGFGAGAEVSARDAELGLRLERAVNLRVMPLPDLQTERDDVPALEHLVAHARALGWDDVQLWRAHGDRSLLRIRPQDSPVDLDSWFRLRNRVERDANRAEQAMVTLRKLVDRRLPENLESARSARTHIEELTRVVVEHAYLRGQAAAGSQVPLSALQGRRPLVHALTSVVVPHRGEAEPLRRTLDALRTHTEGPVEVLVVDCGLDRNARRWLRAQRDVRVVGDGRAIGDPTGHAVGLEIARGETLVLLQAGVEVSASWRTHLLSHLESWPDVGLVAPLVTEDAAPALLLQGQHVYSTRFDPSCVLIRREVFTAIGGIQGSLGRGRLAYDDFALRAAVAGYRTRMAMDSAVRRIPTALPPGPIWPDDWPTFARRWQLEGRTAGDIPFREVLRRPFDPEVHFVPLGDGIIEEDEPVRLLVTA